MRGIAPGQHFAVEQQCLTRFPSSHLFAGQVIQIDALAFLRVRHPIDFWPSVERRRVQVHRAAAVHHKMRVARGGAIRDHGHWFAGRVRRVHLDFDVQHRGQTAQALRAYA